MNLCQIRIHFFAILDVFCYTPRIQNFSLMMTESKIFSMIVFFAGILRFSYLSNFYPDDDFADAGCAITEWKQNRQCGEGIVNSSEEKEPTKAIEFNAKEFQETSENIQKEKIWKTKRYSVPILNYCVSSEKKPRPKSLEGFTKKYGKFRPWSLALNESFQRCLNENAFDSAVKLTGFSIAKITDGSLLQGGRTLEDIPNLKGECNNTWRDECKKVIRSDKVFATDNLQERSVEQQKLSKAKTFNDWSVTGSKYLLELKETGNYLPKGTFSFDNILEKRILIFISSIFMLKNLKLIHSFKCSNFTGR